MCRIDWSHAVFRKSARSNGGNAATTCVEVARVDGTVGVRDSKGSESVVIEFGDAPFTEFLRTVAVGRFVP